MSLLVESLGYKPFKFSWAYDMWKKQQQVHWLAEEVPLADDVRDWLTRLTPAEKNLLTQIFRLFTKSDIEIQDNYMERLSRVFKPTEVKMMLAVFAAMETVHIDAYSTLLETVGMPAVEYERFTEYEAMKAKVDYWDSFNVDTNEDILRTLAMFGGFAEGVQLFASFAMLMNFPRFGKMKGMGQIVSWSVRDESLHAEGIIQLFHEFARETGALTPALGAEIVEIGREVVRQEFKFIDLAFEMGPVEGMTPEELKDYVQFIMDWRLYQLGLGPEVTRPNPLPWLQAMLSGIEHANFFEQRSTSYSKGGSKSDWGTVWDRFEGKT